MAVTNTVRAINSFSFASGALTEDFTLMGVLPQACFALRLVNNTDTDISISYDGTNVNDFIPQGTSLTLPVQTNSQPNNYIANFPIGFSVYVKGTAGENGSIYLCAYYQPRSLV